MSSIPDSHLAPDVNYGNAFPDGWFWQDEPTSVFQFVALTESGRHEYNAPGPTLCDAIDYLERNAVPMTGIPKQCWHFIKTI
jgi:hypothetical protein|tara:strand:- start:545 stop:790 length:246 start_codon:yes stop_codon:yes gene_type:complete